jgi:hypothetical protein
MSRQCLLAIETAAAFGVVPRLTRPCISSSASQVLALIVSALRGGRPLPTTLHHRLHRPRKERGAEQAGRRWCMCPATGCRPGPAPRAFNRFCYIDAIEDMRIPLNVPKY